MISAKEHGPNTLHTLVEEVLDTLNTIDLDTIPDSVKKELIIYLGDLIHAVNLASAQVEEEIKMIETVLKQLDERKYRY